VGHPIQVFCIADFVYEVACLFTCYLVLYFQKDYNKVNKKKIIKNNVTILLEFCLLDSYLMERKYLTKGEIVMKKYLLRVLMIVALVSLVSSAYAQQRGGRGNGPMKGQNAEEMLDNIRNMDEEQIAVHNARKDLRIKRMQENIDAGCPNAKQKLEKIELMDAFVQKVSKMSDEDFQANRDALISEFAELRKMPTNNKGKMGKRGNKGKRGGRFFQGMNDEEAVDAIHNMEAEELALHEAKHNMMKKRLQENIDSDCGKTKERLAQMQKFDAFIQKVRAMSDEEFEANLDDLKAELKTLKPKKGMRGGRGHGRGHGRGMGGGL